MIAVTPPEGTAEEILAWTYKRFRRVALVASFQAESLVLIDLACRIVAHPEVLTLDTGRLHEETLGYMEEVRERYPIRLRILSPDAEELEAMTGEHGTMQFRRSIELRNECCAVRKVNPLARALEGYDAWITGLRREQTPTRAATPVVASDRGHGDITKVVPLAGWTREEVWDYLSARGIEAHPLYARGYTSIGCAPCTRATAPGEGERAGRWWWEGNSDKECMLHPPLESAAIADLRGRPVSVPSGPARSTLRPSAQR
ncbi:MAG: phosphoadenylyl-sulfate reductase [Candidatus Dormiibacterota bacterium]